MRKILFLALSLCSIAITSQGQITKGSILLGGDLSFSSVKKESSLQTSSVAGKQSGFQVSPVFGKAVKENLIFGGSLSYGGFKNEYDNPDNVDSDMDQYGAGLFLRKYKNIGSSGFYIFLQSDLKWLNIKTVEFHPRSIATTTTKINDYSISLYPGLSYAVSKKIHIEAGFANLLALSYSNKNEKQQVSGSTFTYNDNDFDLTSSLDNATYLTVGVRFILSKK